jgi:uncharacterized protein (TIGR02271 family)
MASKGDKTSGRAPMRKIKPAVIPVIQEQTTVSKRMVETGKVRIAKHVREYEEMVDVPHFQEEVQVRRVPVNQFVDAAPEVRTEGAEKIVPVMEERYVVEKRLFLVEELHIRKERHESHSPQTVRVLKEEVEVERISPAETQRRSRRTAVSDGPGRQGR